MSGFPSSVVAGAPVDLDLDYERLQLMASKALLKEPLSSPEYASFRRFMRRHAQDVLAAFPTAASVPRVTAFDPTAVEARCLQVRESESRRVCSY